jgi:sacsin
LKEEDMVKMLKYATNCKNEIVAPLESKDKWLSWVRAIWEVLKTRFNLKLDMFNDLPIFPVVLDYEFVEQKRMCLFSLKANILYMSSLRQLEGSKEIYRCMNYLGVTVTDNVPDWLDYNLIRTYLPEDNSQGLISVFSKIDELHANSFNTKSSSKNAATLLKFVSSRILSDLTSSGAAVFKMLKLFRGYTKKDEWQVVSLKQCNELYVGEMIPVRFPERLIKIESETEVSFAKRLQINSLNETDVILKTLEQIKNYQAVEKQILMYWIMEQKALFCQDKIFSKMRDIEFIQASNGLFYKPSALFDPNDQKLVDLFRDQSVFPVLESSQDFQYIINLKKLGLKSRDQVTGQDLENICSSLHGTTNFEEKQCRALLVVMNEKSELLLTCNISNKCCILVEKVADGNYPTCVPQKNVEPPTLCSPGDIKSKEYMHLVGSTMYMLDCKLLQSLSLKFGWQKQPSVLKVVEHLYNIVCHFSLEMKSECLSMITKVYQWLAEYEGPDIKDIFERQFASNKRYIWFGKGFEDPKHIYIEDMATDTDLEPLLYKLPSEVNSLRNFFVRIGCQERLNFDLYLDCLYRIKEESESQSVSITYQMKLRKLAVAILNKIQEDFKDEYVKSKKDLYFPVKCEQTLMLKPTKQCTFCDAQWLEDIEIGDEEEIFYVHPDVPTLTAETLGVPSLRQQMLSNAEAFEDWGQEEPLTRRLRNLLDDGYLEGSIAKELFQNADDAGANKLHILLDERENNDYKVQLISDGMAECQGPAVWVFNDAQFTDEDLKNITKLSGGTKGNDSTKIGKFGLGFCSVYNLTDVPSFVSRDNVVIFDPHTSYLGKALSVKSPGLKINFKVSKNLNMMKKMKNQFKPFENVFGCKLTNDVAPKIEGTLFRLPLRNKGSEISDAVYTQSKVKRMFNNIMSVAANMLLFSQNVTSVKLFYLSKSEKNPLESKLLFQACKGSKLMSDTNVTGSFLKEASRRKQQKELSDNPISSVENVKINVKTHAIFDLNSGGILKADGHETKSDWLLSWATGTEEKMVQQSYEEKGAINLGAIAVPVTLNDRQCNKKAIEKCGFNNLPYGFYDKGHLFFFLPLPIDHKFPFHINGQFAVSACRQQLHQSAEDDGSRKKRDWNENILKDPVTHALLNLLEGIKPLYDLKQWKFFDLWPRNEQDQMLKHLQQSFYNKITIPYSHNLFERNGHWFDISKTLFLDMEFRKSEIGPLAFEVLSSLQQFLIDIPDDIYRSLLEANKTLIEKRTVTEEQFFLQFFFRNLGSFEETSEKRNTILKHAIMISEYNPSIENWLKSNECIPSLPHQVLKKPCHLINPNSALAKLFCKNDGRFPSEFFSKKKLLGPLEDLGLLSKFLSDELVCDRAQSIQNLSSSCIHCAFVRTDHFLTYICENFSKHKGTYSKMQDIPFVPVKRKPDDWPFKWYSEGEEHSKNLVLCDKHSLTDKANRQFAFFTTAPNLFYSECRDIVGCVALVFEESVSRVSDGDILKQFLSEIGMNGLPVEKVEQSVVINQLKTVATLNSTTEMSATNDDIIGRIYKHLDDSCKSANVIQIEQQLKDIRTVYVSKYVSKCFVSPRHVAKNVTRDCKPYLFHLAESPLQFYPHLSKTIGVADSFKALDLALFVQDVKLKNKNFQLEPLEVNAIINILKCLIDAVGWDLDSIMSDELEAIFAPDENGILRDCKEMCFNDFKDIEKSETMIYAHNEITANLARHLGIKPKAVQNLENHSEDITDFYQDEPLVTRLKRLVEGYPLDIGIFKELLQNADDANATEIVFLKDYDTHPKTNIADAKFIPLQGPALCVYNNSAFSNEDLIGIQKLGRGSKADDPSQTGRYGVGFNAVYNLTDAPSFFTKGGDIENGETICFFDPLAKYIPNATRQKPGKRYKNVESIRCHHNDMMKGYHETYFHSDKVTVFRFPLRTVKMAESSEIKDEPIGVEDVSALLDTFCNELGEIVLFLRNIKTVRVASHQSGKYVEDFSVTLHFEQDCELQKNKAMLHYSNMCRDMKTDKKKVLTTKQHLFLYQLTASENKKGHTNEKKYIIVQSLGFKNHQTLPDLLRQSFLDGKIGLAPYGGVALYTGHNSSSWDFHNEKSCKAFCFLPLPIETNLPVHIQGYFSLDHESRRTLWKSDMIDKCYRTLWNKVLIESVIAPAYVKLLEYIKGKMFEDMTEVETSFSTVQFLIYKYQSLFPCNAKADYWEHLMCHVYNELIMNDVPFLPSLATRMHGYSENVMKTTELSWTAYKGIDHKFPSYHMPESEIVDEDNSKSDFNNILRSIGMKIVSITPTMRDSIQHSGFDMKCVSPDILVNFLCSFNDSAPDKCKIETEVDVEKSVLTSIRNAATILDFCLKDKKYLLEKLTNIPLMITHDNIIHTLPNDDKFYVLDESSGRFNDLFPTKSCVFLSGPVSSSICRTYRSELKDIRSLQLFGLQEFVFLVQETGIINTTQRVVDWTHELPDPAWITLFWDFFKHIFPRASYAGKLDILRSQMHYIKFLPLIPSFNNDHAFLVPYFDLKRLINVDSFENSPQLKEIFTKLNIQQVDGSYFSKRYNNQSEILSLLMELIPNQQNPKDLAECLIINVDKLTEPCINTSHARQILEYFNYTCESFAEEIYKLQLLPLFETHFGELICLSKFNEKIILDKDIPNDGLRKLSAQAKGLALLKDTGYNQLFESLQIKKSSWVYLYERYLIPYQDSLEREEFYKHVEFLSTHIVSNPDLFRNILSLLQNAEFVETTDRKRVLVSKLFDPSKPIFKLMCDKSELVPERFKSNENIMKMFELIGLQKSMTLPLFLRFAKHVEKSEKINSRMTVTMSESVLTNLMHMKKSFFDENDFNELATIRFVTPFVVDEKMLAIHEQFNMTKLICFEGAILNTSKNISWTILDILPPKADPTAKTTKLRICKRPSSDKLILHCINVGRSLCDKRGDSSRLDTSTIMSIMESIYQELQECMASCALTTEQKKTFENVPIIYSQQYRCIHLAKSVVNVCKEEEVIPPYLNKCPNELAKYHDLFSFLGAHNELDTDVFSKVLNDIASECGISKPLLPKDYADSQKAMGAFFKYLIQQNEDIPLQDGHLILLSKDETLEPSNMMVLANNKHYECQLLKISSKEMKLLFPIERLPANVKVEDCIDSLNRLPPKWRPHLLTDLIKERVCLEGIVNKDVQVANELEQFIHSPHFIKGFIRLTRHVIRSNNMKWNTDEDARLASKIGIISFKHASGIKTNLYLACIDNDGEVGDETMIRNTENMRSVHLEKSKNGGVCVYFDSSDQKWFQTLTRELTLHLNSLVNKCLKDESMMILMDMIGLKHSPEDIENFLSKEKIDEYDISIEIKESPTYPVPGTFVPKYLHDFLDNDYGIIQDYEYKFIAFEVEDPDLNEDQDKEETEKECDATYIFVHINRKLDHQDSTCPLLQEYEINDGTEIPRIVKAYQLFKFVRNRAVKSTEITVYDGKDNLRSQPNDISLKDARKEVRNILREAWSKEGTERRRIIKRLLLRWHPDKNHGNENICTKVFQYIQQCLSRLEKGQELIDDDDEDSADSQWSSGGSSSSGQWTSWSNRYWSRYRRGWKSKTGYKRPFNNFDDFTFSRGTNETEEEPYHWYSEARRWIRQAESDISNAELSFQHATGQSYNWICYKAHQV